MAASFFTNVPTFLAGSSESLLNALVQGSADKGFSLLPDQWSAWRTQFDILHSSLLLIGEKGIDLKEWGLLLEYQIPGRPKRLDAVILDGHGIIAIEFKVGGGTYLGGDKWQLREYCWNLRDFHVESEHIPIAPILAVTEAPSIPAPSLVNFEDEQKVILPLQLANANNFAARLEGAHARLVELGGRRVDLKTWDESQSHTTRSIVEEAQRLFGSHEVLNIQHAHADNTGIAHAKIIEIASESRAKGLHSICFITGVPGAGKTLVGLNAAYSSDLTTVTNEHASFASGNKPLLDVLQAALKIDRTGASETANEVGFGLAAPVQNVHDFALRNLLDSQERAPMERVIVFDEAQRVWTQEKVKQGLEKRVHRGRLTREDYLHVMKNGHSEPEILLQVMGRCEGWCLIIALVGAGQEIHDGEAGLAAWGGALELSQRKWTIWASLDALDGSESLIGQSLFPQGRPTALEIRETPGLHLSVTKRSPRAEHYSQWVNYVLSGDHESARRVLPSSDEFPILLVRDIDLGKLLLREYSGADRAGLLASSGAIRLRSEGIEVGREFRGAINYADWFLKNAGDIRGSNQLEIAATEFECQGLELDWAGVCWGGDLVISDTNSGWIPRKIWTGKMGPRWIPIKHDQEKAYARNKYRVLLSRARFGLVIFVPKGRLNDSTTNPLEFQRISEYLQSCGLTEST